MDGWMHKVGGDIIIRHKAVIGKRFSGSSSVSKKMTIQIQSKHKKVVLKKMDQTQ